MKEKFVAFLQSKNLLQSFEKLTDANYAEALKSFDHYFEITKSPDGWIAAAFAWNKSPQGHDFWEEIEREWLTEIGVY